MQRAGIAKEVAEIPKRESSSDSWAKFVTQELGSGHDQGDSFR